MVSAGDACCRRGMNVVDTAPKIVPVNTSVMVYNISILFMWLHYLMIGGLLLWWCSIGTMNAGISDGLAYIGGLDGDAVVSIVFGF